MNIDQQGILNYTYFIINNTCLSVIKSIHFILQENIILFKIGNWMKISQLSFGDKATIMMLK